MKSRNDINRKNAGCKRNENAKRHIWGNRHDPYNVANRLHATRKREAAAKDALREA